MHDGPTQHPVDDPGGKAAAEARNDKLRELDALRARARELEDELLALPAPEGWQPHGYYTGYYATAGFLLGIVGAAVSLLANVVGSLLWTQLSGHEQNPLRLIQVYLTFPLGEAALSIDNGLTLAIGCVLYLGTGMVYGMVFHLLLTRFAGQAGFLRRLALVSLLSVAVWLLNFYGILSWLQPLLFHGNWIVTLVPWWVAALTHLVFGWTMVVLYPWGLYVPYRVQSE